MTTVFYVSQCCQVKFPKNPNIALKKSQDSLFFPEKSQDSHFNLLTSFQVPLIVWSDHYTQQISNIKSK